MLLSFAACSGDSDDTPTPPPTPTISVQLSSAAGTVARGASGTTTVSLTRGGNYTGTVTLAAANLPTGVTATFAPATLSGTTTSAIATIAVGANAAPGTSSITVSASGSGVTAASATYALTVPTPAIALSAGSTALSVVQGGNGTVPVTITRSNGFADAVTLAVSGLPTGVTGTFTPATIATGATTSTLSLAVGAGAAAGTTSFTITASGTGVTAQTATVALTVTAAATPAFALTATPAAVTVTAGQSTTSAVGISRTGGFAGEVTLALENAPAGMTGTFSANPVGGTATASTLTLATTGATVPGTYNLTVRGTGTGVTAQTAAIAVTVAAAPGVTISAVAAQTLSQGSSSATAIPLVLTRTGGLAGDLTMSLEGAPAGVTATFAPNPATASSTQMTLTAALTTAPGTYPLVVRATGAGGASGTAAFSLTVTAVAVGSYTMAAVPSTVSVVQGQTGLSTINIARAGGFTGAVTLAATGLPTGATATFTPTAPTGTQSQLGIQVGAATPAGTYTVTITGTAAGLANVTTTLALTVTASGGGTGNINWRFCDLEDLPVFFAYRAGTSGAWTRVTPSANNTYSFTLNGAGSVVIARPLAGGLSNVQQYNFAANELAETAASECAENPVSKTLTGTVAGLSGTQTAQISVGGGTGTATLPTGNYTITDASTGTTDLLAFRVLTTVGGNFLPTTTPDRVILRRNVDYPAGSAIPLLDFNGAEAFPPATATYTLNGAGAGEGSSILSFFTTANGASGGFLFGALLNTTGSATVYGIPSNRLAAGDFHFAIAFANAADGSAGRGVFQYNRELANRAITLGPQLSAQTASVAGTAPYVRLRSAGTWQAEYADGVGVTFTQGSTSANTRGWTISQSRAFAAGSSYQLEMADLSGTAGWNNSWGFASGLETTVSATGIGGAVRQFLAPAEGAGIRVASRTTQITP